VGFTTATHAIESTAAPAKAVSRKFGTTGTGDIVSTALPGHHNAPGSASRRSLPSPSFS